MSGHTQGPGMGRENSPTRGQSREAAASEQPVWSVARQSGTKSRRAPGLDVLLTKAAVTFQTLQGSTRDTEIKRECEALREAFGVDAFLVAQFDSDHERIEQVIG